MCRFPLLTSTVRLSNGTPKITQIWTIRLRVTLSVNMAPFGKGEKILMKSLYERKGYNVEQYITVFPDNGWTKNSINRLVDDEDENVPNNVTRDFRHFQ